MPERYIPTPDDDIPSGLCECGCGQPTPLARDTDRTRRYFKGYPTPFCKGHRRTGLPRYIPAPEEIPTGLCECGCGNPTPVAGYTAVSRRLFRGYPKPYLHGHAPKRSGFASHKWKGGRSTHRSGYVYVYAPDHPDTNGKGYVFEHRLVAEKTIGRYLLDTEAVHHINGVKDDNRPENLIVMTHAEHTKHHIGEPTRRHATKEQLSAAGKKSAQVNDMSARGKMGAAKRWGHD